MVTKAIETHGALGRPVNLSAIALAAYRNHVDDDDWELVPRQGVDNTPQLEILARITIVFTERQWLNTGNREWTRIARRENEPASWGCNRFGLRATVEDLITLATPHDVERHLELPRGHIQWTDPSWTACQLDDGMGNEPESDDPANCHAGRSIPAPWHYGVTFAFGGAKYRQQQPQHLVRQRWWTRRLLVKPSVLASADASAFASADPSCGRPCAVGNASAVSDT
jgi:hypothetical protein